MEFDRFKAIVAAYGADPRRWPEGERAAVQAFAQANASSVSGLLAAERALDGLIEAGAAEAPSDLLAARIMARAPRRSFLSQGGRRAVFALAACAVLGLVMGFAGSNAFAPGGDEASDTILAAAFQGEAPEIAWLGEEG